MTGTVIGAARVPERFYPGRFDLALNSHNLMHIVGVGSAWAMHTAVVLDFDWMAWEEGDKCPKEAMRNWYSNWHNSN